MDPRHFRSAAAVTSGRHLRVATAGVRHHDVVFSSCHASRPSMRAPAGQVSCIWQPETPSTEPCSHAAVVGRLALHISVWWRKLPNHAALADGERPGVLDFGGTSDVLFVGDGGTMAFERVTMAGFAPANGRGSPNADSVFWPSVQLAPGATVSDLSIARYHCLQGAMRWRTCCLCHVPTGCKHLQVHICRDCDIANFSSHCAFCTVQISFDSVQLRYQRGQEYADCGAYQVCTGS